MWQGLRWNGGGGGDFGGVGDDDGDGAVCGTVCDSGRGDADGKVASPGNYVMLVCDFRLGGPWELL